MTNPTAALAPLMRTRRETDGAIRDFFVASMPAALMGAWALGRQVVASHAGSDSVAAASIESAIWQLRLLDRLELPSSAGFVQCLLGFALLAPALLVALAVSRGWAELFARTRSHPLDPSWALAAWLFVLLLPAGVPAHWVALGMSFGALFGCHVFGGTGRYLVNPSLLGAVFLIVAYPETLTMRMWIPGTEILPAWQSVAAGGVDSAALSWTDAFLGRHVGAFGTTSAAACLFGALYLFARRSAAWQSGIGATAGLAIASWGFATVPWYWQPVLGSFAFIAAFILTDPTTAARSVPGRWLQAILFGVLTLLIRTLNPDHPEGTLFALLLAVLCTPLLDHIAVRWRIAARQRRHAR
jgi:Na+-transporting NADH:ubiquinone oxidoreductase subunit B